MKDKSEASESWPFVDSPDVAVFTTKSVISRERDIVLVTHDLDDGAWQFHPAEEEGNPDEYVRIVSLRKIVEIDPTLSQIAALPLGWLAQRVDKSSNWIQKKSVRGN